MTTRPAMAACALLLAQSALAADEPLYSLPYTPSLDVTAMDRTVDPCEDLYTYSCGGWQRRNPIPPDQASWGVYGKQYVDNQRYLWGILQQAAVATPQRTAAQQKIGDYFASCMDEAKVERRGLEPLRADLDRISNLESIKQLPSLLGELHARTSGSGILFAGGVQQDARDATKVIAAIYAGGIGLPDRDFYLREDDKSKATRERYREHVAAMFILSGSPGSFARTHADTVLRMETTFARASLGAVDKRDPYKTYHRTSPRALQRMTSDFDWDEYFEAAGLTPGSWLNVAEPEFLRAVNRMLGEADMDDWKVYLTWALLDAQAAYLSKAFVDEDFAFYSAYMRGVEQQRPRWKRCVSLVDRDVGEALGKEFVERTFPAAVKAQTIRMTEQIEHAMQQRIEQLDWMSKGTKKQALAKLAKMRNKVGYPDVWRDYSNLQIAADDFYGNIVRAARFESNRQAAKIGKPVDHSEWGMSAPTVNAYYDAQLNDINFPAGVLLPPLYDPKMDDAPNYGNTGGTIGHELTHGFDDEGRQFDGDGNLRDWWSKRDAKSFEKGAQCIRDQYSTYTIVDDIKIKGELTSGEDIADLGGLIVAWMAWQEQTKAMQLTPSDELTPEQRFFVGFAQWACANERPENLRVTAVTDPHSPPIHRINGLVVNMPEFAKAFQCKAGKKLVKKPADICKIW